jgi:RNA recognition motif-containing protein
MGKRIFVGNLPFSANDQVLNDTFAQYGTVESAKVIVDRATGRSKGFGFVEMSTDAEATTAIEKLNGAEYEGRTITVDAVVVAAEAGVLKAAVVAEDTKRYSVPFGSETALSTLGFS